MEGSSVYMINQNLLPFEFKIYIAKNYQETCVAIKTMIVRGAGAIGAAAGFAMAQAYLEAPASGFEDFIVKAKKQIEETRPTARNLFYAVERVFNAGKSGVELAVKEARSIAEENIEEGRKVGEYGNDLIKDGYRIETHCNAGWLAFVDHGTALSVVYAAHRSKKNLFVYVDETRPRSQGARLTAWELHNENVPHRIIADNAGAHLMSKGLVDIIIVGADRVAANGDVANKIGTLEKAIVAKEYGVPFYVAAPYSTIDKDCKSGDEIIIEERNEEEMLFQTGLNDLGEKTKILVASPGSKALNPAFDVTPAKFISGIITDKGVFAPGEI
jgi:methylthioribose-1-phosphate isomerase